jgi:predicted membrane channel-forming protein YqfA (hemolysin III family)
MIAAVAAAAQLAAAIVVALAGLAFLFGGVCYLTGVVIYRHAQRERAAASDAAVRRLARAIGEILSSPADAGQFGAKP